MGAGGLVASRRRSVAGLLTLLTFFGSCRILASKATGSVAIVKHPMRTLSKKRCGPDAADSKKQLQFGGTTAGQETKNNLVVETEISYFIKKIYTQTASHGSPRPSSPKLL